MELAHLKREGLSDVEGQRGFFLDMVSPHVLLQRHSLSVALTTDLTDEGTLASVEAAMHHQRGRLGETLSTMFTLIRLLS